MNVLGGKTRNITKVLMNRPTYRFFTFSSRSLRAASLKEPSQPSEKFTQSPAAKWKSFDTFTQPKATKKKRPKAEPFVVSISVSVFLIYFLCLREENDIDFEMDKPLYERLPTLERAQLKAQIRHNQRDGLGTEHLEERLLQVNKEIRRRQEKYEQR